VSFIAVIREREQQAAKPRDDRGRALSPREVLMDRMNARRGAHR